MKSINRNDFTIVGSVAKTHATKGELKLIFNLPVKIKEWVFLEIREKPVPFFVELFKQTYANEAIIKLAGIITIEDAEKHIGKNILMPSKLLKQKKLPKDVDFTGYQIIDERVGELGLVESVLDMPQQTMLQTTYNNNELLIPAIEPILTEISNRKKTIKVNLPDGFLEINSR